MVTGEFAEDRSGRDNARRRPTTRRTGVHSRRGKHGRCRVGRPSRSGTDRAPGARDARPGRTTLALVSAARLLVLLSALAHGALASTPQNDGTLRPTESLGTCLVTPATPASAARLPRLAAVRATILAHGECTCGSPRPALATLEETAP